MSLPQKRKYKRRNFHQEAEMQIKILEQKAREDFLVDFSENDISTTNISETCVISTQKPSTQYAEEGETKLYISPKAKSVLEKWMYDHRLYCYPTKTEKQALALETGLSVQKISNWFINSRRRMLPKMLQIEGRNPINFTISRKKKKATAPTTDETRTICRSNPLTTYAIAEESKIIDQDSIFFAHELELSNHESSSIDTIQDIIVPYTESDDEIVQESYRPTDEYPENVVDQQTTNHITQGILYDQSTQSKCFFVIVNAQK